MQPGVETADLPLYLADIPAPATTERPLGQPAYLGLAEEIAQEVQHYGDVVDKTGSHPFGKLLVLTASVSIASGTIGGEMLTTDYHVLPLFAGIAGNLAAYKIGGEYYGRRQVRSMTLLQQQAELAESCGEQLEFFRDRRQQLHLRWYGAHKPDDDHPKAFEDRAQRVADIAEHTQVAAVHVGPATAAALDLPQAAAPQPEKVWLKELKDWHDNRPLDVVSAPLADFTAAADQLALERPFQHDTELLHSCLDYLRSHKAGGHKDKLFSREIELDQPLQLQKLSRSLGREIQTYLDDFDVERTDYGRRKIYKLGALGRTSARTAANPTIHWFGDGSFQGTQSLLDFMGETPEQLQATLADHAGPKEKYRAALLLAYIESVKIQNGLNAQPEQVIEPQTESQPAYQANLKHLRSYDSERSRTDIPARPSRLTPKHLAKAAFKGLVAVGLLGAVLYQPEVYHSVGPNRVLTPIDQTLYNGLKKFGGRTDGGPNTRTVSRSGIYSSLADPGGMVGNVSQDDNQPLWFIHSFNGADSEGYWETNVDSDLIQEKGSYTWAPSLAAAQTIDLTAPNGQDDDHIFNGAPGFKVERTVTKGMLLNGALTLPLKNHSQLLAVHIAPQNNEAAGYYPSQLQTGTNGLVLDVDKQWADLNGQPDDSSFTITYWLKDGGNQGVMKATSKVMVSTNQGRSQPAATTALQTVWANHLPAGETAKDYLQHHKTYGLTPLDPDLTANNETELLQAILDSPTESCNTSATALVLDDPQHLNVGIGFYNHHSGPVDMLSAHEAHAYAVDQAGTIIDGTPPATDDLNNFFAENFKESAKTNSSETDKTIALIGLGTTATVIGGSVALMVGGSLRFKRRKKRYEALDDQAAQAGQDVIDHMLFHANSDEPIVWSSKPKSRDEIHRYLHRELDTRPKTLRRQLNRYSRQHDLPRPALQAARTLLRFN